MRFFPSQSPKSSQRDSADPPPAFGSDDPGGSREDVRPYQEAPGYKAKKLYPSSPRKEPVSKHGHEQRRDRGRSLSTDRKEPAGSLSRERQTNVTSPRLHITSPQSQAGSPRSQIGSPTSQGRSTRSRVASPQSGGGSPRSETGSPKSKERSPRSKIASPRSRGGSPRSEIGSPTQGRSPRSQVASPSSPSDASTNSPRSSSRSPSKSRRFLLSMSRKKEPLLAPVPARSPLSGHGSKQVPVYQPPIIPDTDSADGMLNNDRYATVVGPHDSLADSPPEEALPSNNVPLVRPVHQRHPLGSLNEHESYESSKPYTIQALSQISSYFSSQSTKYGGASVYGREPQGSELSGETFFDEPSTMDLASFPPKDGSSEFRSFGDFDSGQFVSSDGELYSEDGFILVKQRVAYLCIFLSATQLGIVLIQLAMCGIASLYINPMIGPYPDAFSEWGGKNVYLLLEEKQYYRIITPVFLHVGVLHLLVNCYCQLETCAYFEREWGSLTWATIYFISGLGSVLTASVFDPDVLGVCSSGALMGLFGAKIAQAFTWTIFDLGNHILAQTVQFDQLGGVMCSTAMVSLLSFFTYIDWSGQLGGLAAGFLAGITFFSRPIANGWLRVLWASLGFAGLAAGGIILTRVLLFKTEPDEELADACQYFRVLYPEGYNCDCVWD